MNSGDAMQRLSVTGRIWRDSLDAPASALALSFVQEFGLSDIVARVLVARGVTKADLPAYLDPKLRELMPDPSTLQDMDRLVARLADAIERRETVAIFGDYDVDGACSTALLAGYLDACDVPRLIHIPDRLIEGYGPNSEAIRMLADRGAHVLVTVDCGTTSHEPLAEAARLGLDTLVIDHHQAPEVLPEARALVNPNRLDDLSTLGHLCAAGVVFMVLVALTRVLRSRNYFANRHAPDLMAMLDLVALATIADVVPLKGLNRAFVRQGLHIMRQRSRAGLRALCDKVGLDGPVTPYHLGFLIGPRINAGGRIGDAALGARLLLTHDDVEADEIAATLDKLNRERQDIEVQMVAEAEAEALASLGLDETNGNVIVTASPNWHPGVVGLVAARLKERFKRPAFAIALGSDGFGTGSGRSVKGVDLGRAVRACVDAGILVKGGGHAMAAGVTIATTQIPQLRAMLEDRIGADAAAARAHIALDVDGRLTAGGVTVELIHDIEKAGPFGSAQPEPLFVLMNHIIVDAALVGASHVRVRIKSQDGTILNGIAFRAFGQPLGDALMKAKGATLDLAGHLGIDRWGGGEKAQFRVVDAAIPLR